MNVNVRLTGMLFLNVLLYDMKRRVRLSATEDYPSLMCPPDSSTPEVEAFLYSREENITRVVFSAACIRRCQKTRDGNVSANISGSFVVHLYLTDTHKEKRDRANAVFHGFMYSPTHLQAEEQSIKHYSNIQIIHHLCQPYKTESFYEYLWLLRNAPLPDTDIHKEKRDRAKAVFHGLCIHPSICRQRWVQCVAIDSTHDANNRHS
ncbi:hypothetical protein CEXT_144141 [Caerostris extrusa]|uniref:Uncharacterized protein n=1 Tax=Caerostris extrusa TaxID=172846 RepID=A0AAV4MKG0_CAEEX|nr:hypothetical protein CEXT_144141 [Caerostris extrusa]